MINSKTGTLLLLLWITFTLTACHTVQFRSPIKVREGLSNTKDRYAGEGIEKSNWAEKNDTHLNLISLPKPKGKILVSAYGFRDQSGQYKQAPANGFSTAVSQGANAILVKALKDSDWFVPIEREALQNLLTERKIIRAGMKRSSRDIPPLLGASILFEGGVIGYDSNIKTGGAGAKYFGLGVAEQYRVDQITVSLRAIDIYSGKIINTVVVNKSIFSKETTAGFYRFVRFKRLLEMEAGYTRNEPVQLALVDAIETSVLKMVVDGIQNRLWSLANPIDIQNPVIQQYLDIDELTKSNPEAIEKKNKPLSNTNATSNLNTTPNLSAIPADDPVPDHTPAHDDAPTHDLSTKTNDMAEPSSMSEPNNPSLPATLSNEETGVPKTAIATPKSKSNGPTESANTTRVASKVRKQTLPDSATRPVEALELNHQSSFPLDLLASPATPAPLGPYYAIQLVSSSKAMGIVDFITDTELNLSDLRLINYPLNGTDQYALLYGAYENKKRALQAIITLPESVKAHGPWLRLINQDTH